MTRMTKFSYSKTESLLLQNLFITFHLIIYLQNHFNMKNAKSILKEKRAKPYVLVCFPVWLTRIKFFWSRISGPKKSVHSQIRVKLSHPYHITKSGLK